jgi:hypothetical protein
MRSRLTRARFVIAVVALVGVLETARANAYVLPVTDVFNWIRNQAISLQTAWQIDVLNEQRRTVRKMARRLSEYVGDLRARFAVRFDDPPRWRTHDFESDRYLYGRIYGAALNYGDSTGRAVESISRPTATVTEVPPSLTPTARRNLERAFATIDVADAILRDGTNQSGIIRYGGRSLIAATSVFDQDALDPDFEQSTSAVLDKLNASAVLELKQKQGRNDLLATALEMAVLDNKRHRDAETIAMNQRLRATQYYREYARTFFSPESLATASAWRMP